MPHRKKFNPYPGSEFRHLRPDELRFAHPPENHLACASRRKGGRSEWFIFYYLPNQLDNAEWV